MLKSFRKATMSKYDTWNYSLNTMPRTEFSEYMPAHSEASDTVLKAYYIITLFMALAAIVTGAGQIYTRNQCSSIDDDTGVTAFFVIAIITIVLAFVVVIMSIYALIYKLGYRHVYTTEPSSERGARDTSLLPSTMRTRRQRSMDHTRQGVYKNLAL